MPNSQEERPRQSVDEADRTFARISRVRGTLDGRTHNPIFPRLVEDIVAARLDEDSNNRERMLQLGQLMLQSVVANLDDAESQLLSFERRQTFEAKELRHFQELLQVIQKYAVFILKDVDLLFLQPQKNIVIERVQRVIPKLDALFHTNQLQPNALVDALTFPAVELRGLASIPLQEDTESFTTRTVSRANTKLREIQKRIFEQLEKPDEAELTESLVDILQYYHFLFGILDLESFANNKEFAPMNARARVIFNLIPEQSEAVLAAFAENPSTRLFTEHVLRGPQVTWHYWDRNFVSAHADEISRHIRNSKLEKSLGLIVSFYLIVKAVTASREDNSSFLAKVAERLPYQLASLKRKFDLKPTSAVFEAYTSPHQQVILEEFVFPLLVE